MTLTHAGLFEGVGGTTMAAELVLGRLDTRWVSDIKPAAVALLAQRRSDVPNIGDMRWPHYARVEDVDVLTLSWPCQPHSSAGKRLGAADPRALWPYCEHAIRHLRPAVVLGENVARIATNGELDRVVAGLERLGYRVSWQVQRADHIGVCHRRARLFLVAIDPAQPRALERVAERLQPTEAGRGGACGQMLPTPSTRDGKGRTMHDRRVGTARPQGRIRAVTDGALPDAVALLPTPSTRNGNGIDRRGPRPEGGGYDLQTVAVQLLPTPTTRNVAGNRVNGRGDLLLPGAVSPERFGAYATAVARHEQLLGRPAPDPTMPGARGTPVLNPWFVEWMMCFPLGHVCGVDDLGQTRASSWRPRALSLLGDAVVPLQGAAAYGPLLAAALTDVGVLAA